MEVKKKVFAELDAMMPEKTIFGSNTSALPCTPMAAATKRADRFLIVHFHQPPVVMKLVELARGLDTSDETVQAAKDWCVKIGKVPVVVKIDAPGYITNRISCPQANEAVWALYEGVATKEDIDTAFKYGFNHPMGPLEISDFVGLDTLLHIYSYLHEQYGGNKYLPCPLLKNMVAAGKLGVKTGEGFYKWDKTGKKIG
jgi:3-hydroxybutyryl-CoA dehydrogenase